MRIGVARVPITPAAGIVHLRGFASRHRPAQSVHDALLATALVLADDHGPRACLVSCDLCALSPGDSARIEARVGALVGVPAAAVWIACSHTHSGPAVTLPAEGAAAGEAGPAEGAGPPVGPGEAGGDGPSGGQGRYSAWLVDQIAGCAFLAAHDLRPAALGAAWGQAQLGVNRRERRGDGRIVLGENPSGPVDHRTTLLRVEEAGGRPLAAVLHHACHPVVLGPDSYALSADYVGFARAAAESALGVPVLFVQGACGNINPTPRGNFAVAERLGQILGAEAIRLWSLACAEPLAEVRTAARTFDVPLGPLPDLAEAEQEVLRRSAHLAAQAGLGRAGEIAAARMYLGWATSRLRAVGAGRTAASAPVLLRAMRCNGVGLVGAPFEPFVETGVAVRDASPHQPLLFCGYTGGVLTYVPVAEAYPEGGYEVDDAFRHFGLPAPPLPEAEGRLRTAFAEMLAAL